jgi:hypothetical protein
MDKVDKLIQIIHNLKEEGSIANVVGTGGLTGSSTPPGRMDGYDKVMSFVKRSRPTIIGKGKYQGSRKRWSKK